MKYPFWSMIQKNGSAYAGTLIVFGQLLFTGDSLANAERHDERNWGHDSFNAAMDLSFKAILEL